MAAVYSDALKPTSKVITITKQTHEEQPYSNTTSYPYIDDAMNAVSDPDKDEELIINLTINYIYDSEGRLLTRGAGVISGVEIDRLNKVVATKSVYTYGGAPLF